MRAPSFTAAIYSLAAAAGACLLFNALEAGAGSVPSATPPPAATSPAASGSSSSSAAPVVGTSVSPHIVLVGSEPTHVLPAPSQSPSAPARVSAHPSPVRSSAPHPSPSGGGVSAGGVQVAVDVLGVRVAVGLRLR